MSVSIREFQHFLYCPHRWGLVYINNSWAENVYVSKANLMHKTVHRMGERQIKGVKTLYSLPVYWDEYDLYGLLDCAEIEGNIFRIIEYKPSQKNLRMPQSDLMQLFLQKKCVESIYKEYAVECYFYYEDIKRRAPITFDDENQMLQDFINMLCTIEQYKSAGIIPPIESSQYCGGCSMKDVCLPKTKVTKFSSRVKKSLLI